MNFERLLQFEPPRLHLLVTTPGEATDFAWTLARHDGRQVVVRTLRGNKMRTAPQLFDEFAAALQFPYYFGENWDGFLDCVTDLEWLPGSAYVLLILDAIQLLENGPEDSLAVFFDTLGVVAEEWTASENTAAERTRRPFHVVFQCSAAEENRFLFRVHSAGIMLDRLKLIGVEGDT
jgi:hypothetical protein